MIRCDHCHKDFPSDGSRGNVQELCGEVGHLADDDGFCICNSCLAKKCAAMATFEAGNVDAMHAAINDFYSLFDEGYITRDATDIFMGMASRSFTVTKKQ